MTATRRGTPSPYSGQEEACGQSTKGTVGLTTARASARRGLPSPMRLGVGLFLRFGLGEELVVANGRHIWVGVCASSRISRAGGVLGLHPFRAGPSPVGGLFCQ